MSLSVGAIGSFGQLTAVKPLNYALTNQSAVSSAYENSLQSGGDIRPASPVSYPNARTVSLGEQAERIRKARNSDQGYQAIAEHFKGTAASYQRDMGVQTYSLTGSSFDAIA